MTGSTPQTEIRAPAAGGLYILHFRFSSQSRIQIGRSGTFDFKHGDYAYAGSAFGPGGLAARLRRHLRTATQKRRHWHIDHLLEYASIQGVAWSTKERSRECNWAATLGSYGKRQPYGFGASDCRCAGHLIEFDGDIKIQDITQIIPLGLQIQEFDVHG